MQRSADGGTEAGGSGRPVLLRSLQGVGASFPNRFMKMVSEYGKVNTAAELIINQRFKRRNQSRPAANRRFRRIRRTD